MRIEGEFKTVQDLINTLNDLSPDDKKKKVWAKCDGCATTVECVEISDSTVYIGEN